MIKIEREYDTEFMRQAIELSRSAVEKGNEGCNCSRMVFEGSFRKPEVTAGILAEEALQVLSDYFSTHQKG